MNFPSLTTLLLLMDIVERYWYGLTSPLPASPTDALIFRLLSQESRSERIHGSSVMRQPIEPEGKKPHCWLVGNLLLPS